MRHVFIGILALLAAGESHACTCGDLSAVDEPQVAKHADVVFVGEVAKVTMKIDRGLEVVVASFKVLEDRKGVKARFITVEVHHGGTSCDLVRADFRPGDRFLMSASRIQWADPKRAAAAGEDVKAKRYYNNYCDLRERLDAR